jgi:uncharacterized protein
MIIDARFPGRPGAPGKAEPPMSAAEAQAEPTMEEILASIRRIISEGDEPDAGAPSAPETQMAAAEPEDDVLELTDAIDDEPLDQDAIDAAFNDEPLEQNAIDDLMVFDREPEPEPAPAPPPRIPEPISAYDPSESLIGEAAATAAVGSLSKLQFAIPVYTGPEATLETVVKDLLRPMLKQWLDDNLPAIVEAKVEAEVARLARTLR